MTDVVETEFAPRPRTPRGRSASMREADTNPDDLATVDSKIAAFWATHPDGAIDASDVEQVGEDAWRATVRVWKNRIDGAHIPDASASSTRTADLDGHESREFALESCQSIALGRALRFMGILATIPNGEPDAS